MLLELRVENLLLIERAELRLAPGLNVLTGETGAGKTVLAHALDLLLGGRARPGIVRPGAEEAYVEGVFDGPDGEDVVLARRVESPRFRRIETFGPRNHLHAFRLASVAEVDDEVASWLAEAYEVGMQRHLGR